MKSFRLLLVLHLLIAICLNVVPQTISAKQSASSSSSDSEGISAEDFYKYEYNSFFDSRHNCVYATDSEEKEKLTKAVNSSIWIDKDKTSFYPETFTPIYEFDMFFDSDDSVSLVPRWGLSYNIDRKVRSFAVKVCDKSEMTFHSFGFETDGETIRFLFVKFLQGDGTDPTTWVPQSFDYADNARRIKNILKRETFVDPRNVRLVSIPLFKSGLHSDLPLFYIKDDQDECFIEAGLYDLEQTASWEKNDYVYSVKEVASAVKKLRARAESVHYPSMQEIDFVYGLVDYIPLEGHSAGIENPEDLTADNITNTWEYLQEGMIAPVPSSESSESRTEDSITSEGSESGDSSNLSVPSEETKPATLPIIIISICVAAALAVLIIVCIRNKKKKAVERKND